MVESQIHLKIPNLKDLYSVIEINDFYGF